MADLTRLADPNHCIHPLEHRLLSMYSRSIAIAESYGKVRNRASWAILAAQVDLVGTVGSLVEGSENSSID